MRVLVVSDSPVERVRATTGLLRADDVEVLEAETAREAQQRCAAGDVDVLVVDGDLAPKGGFSALYEIRNAALLAGTTSPPALVMIAREQDRWLATWAGANEVRLKPVDPFEVAKLVAALDGAEPAPADPALDAPKAVKARLGRA